MPRDEKQHEASKKMRTAVRNKIKSPGAQVCTPTKRHKENFPPRRKGERTTRKSQKTNHLRANNHLSRTGRKGDRQTMHSLMHASRPCPIKQHETAGRKTKSRVLGGTAARSANIDVLKRPTVYGLSTCPLQKGLGVQKRIHRGKNQEKIGCREGVERQRISS